MYRNLTTPGRPCKLSEQGEQLKTSMTPVSTVKELQVSPGEMGGAKHTHSGSV